MSGNEIFESVEIQRKQSIQEEEEGSENSDEDELTTSIDRERKIQKKLKSEK